LNWKIYKIETNPPNASLKYNLPPLSCEIPVNQSQQCKFTFVPGNVGLFHFQIGFILNYIQEEVIDIAFDSCPP
jgi:hypothetical protein